MEEKTLQEQLLVRALNSSYITNEVLSKDVANLLPNKANQVIGNILVRYYATNSGPITDVALKYGLEQYFKAENLRRKRRHEDAMTPEEEIALSNRVSNIMSIEPDSSTNIETALDSYVKKKLASSVILEEASRDSEDLSKRVEERLDKINSLDINGTSDEVVDVYRDIKPKAEAYMSGLGRAKLSSGLKCFDDVMSGGLEKGQVGLIGGKSGFGKTVFLTNLAYYYSVVSGLNVLQVTLEELKADSYMRFDRLRYRVTPTEMLTPEGKIDPEFLKHEIETVNSKDDDIDGTLLFKRYAPQTLTVDGLRQCINTAERQKGLKLDVVVLDYADLMRVFNKSDNEAVQGEELFQNLSKLAQEEDVVLITGTQLNRTANSQELMTLESIEGSYRKINITAFAGTLNGNKEERDHGYMRVYLDKIRNRFTTEDTLLLKFNKGTMLLSDETEAEKVEHLSLINQDSSALKSQRREEYVKKNSVSPTGDTEMQQKAKSILENLGGK